jgi:hypothetical protein
MDPVDTFQGDKMDTADKADQVKRSPGRPKKADPATPMGEMIAKEAKEKRNKAKENRVVETYYELGSNGKLVLVKRLANGGTRQTFVGSTTDKKQGKGQDLQAFAKKLQDEGRLRIKV